MFTGKIKQVNSCPFCKQETLDVLSVEELCVQDIADRLSMTQSAISHQLRVLKQMSLVKFRRDGKTIYYSLADSHVATIMNQGLEHVTEE